MAAKLPHFPAPELGVFCENHDGSRIGELDAFVVDIGVIKSQNLAYWRLNKKSWTLFLPVYHDKHDAWNSETIPTEGAYAATIYTMYSNLTNFLFNFNAAITTSYRELWVDAFNVKYSLFHGWVRVDVKLDPEHTDHKTLTGGRNSLPSVSSSHLATFFDVSVFKV